MLEKRTVLLLLILLIASNAVWATLYTIKQNEYSLLASRYWEVNKEFTLLAQRASKLEENNTSLLLKLRVLEERLERLADFVETANGTLRKSLLLTRILMNLNRTLWVLYNYTYTHAYFTPDVRKFVSPAVAGDLLIDVIGTSVFDPHHCFQHLRKLYNYTAYEIETSPDQPFIVIRDVKLVEIDGKRFIYSFEVVKTNNYIQSALETLERGAGDCEDKAILLASLYRAYLDDFGNAWVVCVFGKSDYNHCFTVAFVKPFGRFVFADPTLDYYLVTRSVRDGFDKLFAYIGLRWSDIAQAILFNNIVYKSGTIYDIIDYLRSFERR